MALSEEKIIEACDALANSCEKVTIYSVRERLGTGSIGTIQPVVKRWKLEKAQSESSDSDNDIANSATKQQLPDEIASFSYDMTTKIYDFITEKYEKRFLSLSIEADDRIASAEKRADESEKRAELEIDEAMSEFDRIVSEIDALKKSHKSDMREAKDRAKEKDAEIERLQTTISKLIEKIGDVESENSLSFDEQQILSVLDAEREKNGKLIAEVQQLKNQLKDGEQ